MGRVAGGGGGDRVDRQQGHRHEPRDLGEGHQRDRGEVEDETGEAHAAEQGRPDRQQHRLGAEGRRKQGERRRGPRRRPIAPAPERRRHAGRAQHDAEGGAERQQESWVQDRERRS